MKKPTNRYRFWWKPWTWLRHNYYGPPYRQHFGTIKISGPGRSI